MIDCPPTRIWRRVLGLAVCYVLALQAFFAAFERAVALSQANVADGVLVICHSANNASPSKRWHWKAGKALVRALRGCGGRWRHLARSGCDHLRAARTCRRRKFCQVNRDFDTSACA